MTLNNYPTETDGLLSTSNKRYVHNEQGAASRRQELCWNRTPVVVALIVLFLILVLKLNIFPSVQKTEDRLIYKYAEEADQALELLDELSFHKNATAIPVGCESTLLIIRHCEDLGGHVRYDDGSRHCSYLGFQRSLYLATLFGTVDGDGDEGTKNSSATARWPLPSRLYGLWNADGTNKRQYEILHPLSNKSNVPIEMFVYETGAVDLRDIVFDLLSSGQLCNEIAVVAWKHRFIRDLAATLGCDQERGCPNYWDDYDFDTVWELQYVFQPEELRAFPPGHSVHEHSDKRLVDGWEVYGSVTQENFDALAFKKQYYGGDSEVGKNNGNWMEHNHRA